MTYPLAPLQVRKLFWRLFKIRVKANQGTVYGCRHWDSKTKLCKAYDSRPQMCRDYPRKFTCPFCGEKPTEVTNAAPPIGAIHTISY